MVERMDIPIKTVLFDDDIGKIEGFVGRNELSVSISVTFKRDTKNPKTINFPRDAIPKVIGWLQSQQLKEK